MWSHTLTSPICTFMEMQSSLKKRCCAAQKGFHTSRLCAPVSSSASCRLARRSCSSAQGIRNCDNL